MNYLYICSTSCDCISKINIYDFVEEDKIFLSNNKERVGPHGICFYKDLIITANNYNDGISLVNLKKNKNVQNIFIGMRCNDVKAMDDKAYIICGDSNVLIIYDLQKQNIIESIPCGDFPHSIEIDKKRNLILISNMQTNNLTFIDLNKKSIKNIPTGEYPTKAIFSVNGDYIFVCESNIGMIGKGSLAVISIKNFHLITRIELRNSPVDMYCDEKYCYVSNFGEGSISIVDINNFKKVKDIWIGGMPRGILRHKQYLYVGDNYNDLVFKVDLLNKNKKAISIGGEPTGMTLV